MNEVKATFEQFFAFEKVLNLLLDEEDFDAFTEQQNVFQTQLKDFISRCSEQELNEQLPLLEQLEKQVEQLHQRAKVSTNQLKDKSLALQRNKKKLNAYK